MNKETILITPNVIEECLCESFDVMEKTTTSHSNKPKIIEIAY